MKKIKLYYNMYLTLHFINHIYNLIVLNNLANPPFDNEINNKK